MEIKNISFKKLTSFIWIAKAGETFTSISNKFNVNENVLRQNNPHISILQEGDAVWVQRPLLRKVVVTPVDTFKSLSEKYNVSINEIKEKNNAIALFYGQTIIL